MKVFKYDAECYDALYQNKDYEAELSFVAQGLRRHDAKFHRVLELGCGTGAYTQRLPRQFDRVVGIDMSAAMLRQARLKQKLCEQGIAIRYSRGDLRTLRLTERFDVILALFHVMSYQTANADLLSAFKTAARHVKRGGLFYFDFWYGPGVLSDPPVKRVKTVHTQRLSLTRKAMPTLFLARNTVQVHYDLKYTVRGGGETHRASEDHFMRYLFQPEVEELCGRTSFQLLEFCEWMTGRECTASTWNAYAIVRRK